MNHGPRLNRYYEKLKPYYRVDQNNVEEPKQSTTEQSDTTTAASTNFTPSVKLPLDKTLVFESRFESGNLRKAMKVDEFEYELYLKNDYGTCSFTQWFYFRIQNTRKG